MQFELRDQPWTLHLWQGVIKQEFSHRQRERYKSTARLHPGTCNNVVPGSSKPQGPCTVVGLAGETIHNADEDVFRPIAGRRIALERALMKWPQSNAHDGTPLTIGERALIWGMFMKMQSVRPPRIKRGHALALYQAAKKLLADTASAGMPLKDAWEALAKAVETIDKKTRRRSRKRQAAA